MAWPKSNHGENTERQLGNPEKGDAVATIPSRLKGTKADKNTRKVPLDQIITRKQIREDFDEDALQELANSFREHGQRQPCTLFWSETDGKYVLVAGERRFRAAQIAGLEDLRGDILDHVPDDAEHHELQLIENVQREDLNPIEEAKAYQKFVDDFGYTQEQIAKKTGKSQGAISRALKLIKLPEEIRAQLVSQNAPRRLAESLARLDDIQKQRELLEQHQSGQLTVEDARKQTSKRASRPADTKHVRVKKVDGIGLKATGKKKHTNTDYALAAIAWCEDLATDKRATADVHAVFGRAEQLLEKLRQHTELLNRAA
jgi:ParB family chromosome partitioning protein